MKGFRWQPRNRALTGGLERASRGGACRALADQRFGFFVARISIATTPGGAVTGIGFD
ncbi:MAG TPA: hypothetical protein VGN25_10875 [Solirubrobacteraceae bacterium]|jgi:hypothetical protein|nr:hypothetical protein [Solirubrobacteraceae bacterium]